MQSELRPGIKKRSIKLIYLILYNNSRMIVKKRIRTLDGFRGIFALMIILDHANNNSFITKNFIVRNSDYFVDYFFVLSGFVISYNYTSKIKSFSSYKDFIKKRLIRLYPLLLYTSLVYLGFKILWQHFGKANAVESFRLLFLKLTETLSLLNSTPLFGNLESINYPSWSISSEMISYTVFGLVLFAFKKNATAVLSIICLGCILFIKSKGFYLLTNDFGCIRGLFCFILGYFVYLLSRKLTTIQFTSSYELIFLFVLLLFFKYDPLILPILFAVGIYIFINGKGVVSRFLETRQIQFLGRISYSVYLNHAIVLLIIQKVFFNLLKSNPLSVSVNISYLSATILLTIVYSYFTHKYIEVGVSNLLRGPGNKKSIKQNATSDSLP